MKKRILVGMTGASGAPVLVECLKLLRGKPGYHSVLMMTEGARLTAETETDLTAGQIAAYADEVLDIREIGAGPASGSYESQGMLIVPCSMKTLAGIHAGYAENLLLRSADVTIKEHRPLVLGVRETPLSPIHLRNMQELSMIPGVFIMPLMMTFYNRPKTVEEMTRRMAERLLAPFGVPLPEAERWNGM